MASLVSFRGFVKTRIPAQKVAHLSGPELPTNSETGVDSPVLYPGSGPTVWAESEESVTYEARTNSETGDEEEAPSPVQGPWNGRLMSELFHCWNNRE